MSASETTRTELIKEIRLSMGGGMVDLELDPEHYELALTKALETYRQLSENAYEETVAFMDLIDDTNTYFLPEEIVEVRQIFRRSVGSPGRGGVEIDPFELAYTNVYILQAGRQSGLATYDFFAAWQEQAGKMFGFFLNFTWEPDLHKIEIIRRPLGEERIMLWVMMEKTEDLIFRGRYSKPWLRDWGIAESKIMLGNAYRKYASIVGPQGGTTLPGNELVSEGTEEKERLRQKLKDFETGETPSWLVIG